MTLPLEPLASPTYQNPVSLHDFADPFVLKYCGEYWAYASSFWHDGHAFGILRSRDLVHWEEVGGALEPLPGEHTCYWAPEVTYDNGRFYLYYSVGNEERMEIRVAVAEHPGGPFVDSGHRLTSEPFAIDAHVAQDEDGTRYLFYAADFLDHSHVGTGTVRDRMVDFFTLAGEPRPVTRAKYDWQVYDPERKEKGDVRWHTLEGSFVLRHKGLYYQMFSGGNWQNISYGVSYATSPTLDREEEWSQVADGEATLPILRTIPGKVLGPGHNSVVRGPDNQQLYCVYHRWSEDHTARQLAIDPLDWAGERMLVVGPSHTPQPAPLRPTAEDFFDVPQNDGLGPRWRCTGGRWSVGDGAARQQITMGTAEAHHRTEAEAFVMEVSVRADETQVRSRNQVGRSEGRYGVTLYDTNDNPVLNYGIVPDRKSAVVAWFDGSAWSTQDIPLAEGFEPNAYHLLRVEVDHCCATICLDETRLQWEGRLPGAATSVALFTKDMAARFAGFALTVGWQDEFMEGNTSVSTLEWEPSGSERDWRVAERQLTYTGKGEATLVKGPLLADYELVVNARLEDGADEGSGYGFLPAVPEGSNGPRLLVERGGESYALRWQDDAGEQRFTLPAEFDGSQFQQFRFRKEGGWLSIQWENHPIADISVSPEPTRVGLLAWGPGAAWELVRVTPIGEQKEP